MLLKATRPIPRSAEELAREVAALRERLSRLSEAGGGNRAPRAPVWGVASPPTMGIDGPPGPGGP